jgi:adenosylmethionine-8-amino-7-oxononanoate aminotransferase
LHDALIDFPSVGEIRGKGLMVAIDLVSSKETRTPIDPTSGYANAIAAVAMREGAIVRPVGTKIILSPTLTLTQKEVDILTRALKTGFEEVKA